MAPLRALALSKSRAYALAQLPACSQIPNGCRQGSSVAIPTIDENSHGARILQSGQKQLPPLSRLPLPNLLRSLLLSSIFSSSLLLKPSLFISSKLAHSNSRFLNPDRNILLRMLLKPLVYNHFCAGTTEVEVRNTIANLKQLGFSGVALCHGKEILEDSGSSSKKEVTEVAQEDENVESWRQSLLSTLRMVSEGDSIAIKFSGAGSNVTKMLEDGAAPSEQLWSALHEVCSEAQRTKKVIWIDAEKQAFQHTIDRWTIELMRQYNKNGQCTVYNTIQCYLKSSADNVSYHANLAQKEGWDLGLKLVRGAYVDYEQRSLIHDTKEETDAAYDSITENILRKTIPGVDSQNFPVVNVFLASHNAQSIEKASAIARELVLAGEEVRLQGCGQLLGMADEISCKLVQNGDVARAASGPLAAREKLAAPRAIKYLTWGTVQECMGYLHRRAVENSGATARIKEDLGHMKAELWRRMTTSMRLR